MGWHAGPHGFIPPSPSIVCCGFSDILHPGVQCSCGNREELGFECVGNFTSGADTWDTGLGALVRDNAAFVFAVWYKKLGLNPDGLRFHRDCVKDHHACPGNLVQKPDIIARIKVQMGLLGKTPTVKVPHDLVLPPAKDADVTSADGHTTILVQQALNKALNVGLTEDGIADLKTGDAIKTFQKTRGLKADGLVGPKTAPVLKAVLDDETR